MSRHHIEEIECPVCHNKGEFVLWDSINTELDPEMKKKVRTGEAFRYVCDKCGETTDILYGTVYHQMEDHIMIELNFSDHPEDSIEHMKGIFRNDKGEIIDIGFKLDDDYQNRLVTNMNSFREKLLIIDAGLNDKYIELMKFFMFAQLERSGSDMDVKEFLFALNENGEPMFAVRLSDNRWGTTEFAVGLYESIEKDFAEFVEQDKEVVIDSEWARNFLIHVTE